MTTPVLFTVLCLVGLVGTLAAERRGNKTARYIAKPLASLGFIVVCATGGGLDQSYAHWILAGLVLGAGGDVALIFESDSAFLAGLVSFLLGHAAYVVAFAAILAPDQWITLHMAAPIVGGGVVCVYLWPHLGSMKLPVLAYLIVITSMVIGAVAIVLELGGDHAYLLGAGAIAFFISDIAVARDRFVAPGFVNRAWGLPAYYGGQLLLAWSTAVW